MLPISLYASPFSLNKIISSFLFIVVILSNRLDKSNVLAIIYINLIIFYNMIFTLVMLYILIRYCILLACLKEKSTISVQLIEHKETCELLALYSKQSLQKADTYSFRVGIFASTLGRMGIRV